MGGGEGKEREGVRRKGEGGQGIERRGREGEVKGGHRGRGERKEGKEGGEGRGWEGGRRVHELPVVSFCLPAPLYRNITSEAAVYTCVNIHYILEL